MWKFAVVPHEGTWIEMFCFQTSAEEGHPVVPHEGTWIEIAYPSTAWMASSVVPHEGTWIEIIWTKRKPGSYAPSFPTRERGLKYFRCTAYAEVCCRSPRGNVDWNLLSLVRWFVAVVVPHEGTWIEITRYPKFGHGSLSFPTRERGLKCIPTYAYDGYYCRSPRGNVDWNITTEQLTLMVISSFPTRERGLK